MCPPPIAKHFFCALLAAIWHGIVDAALRIAGDRAWYCGQSAAWRGGLARHGRVLLLLLTDGDDDAADGAEAAAAGRWRWDATDGRIGDCAREKRK